MAGLQAPADRIDPIPANPSLLTAARDRTRDGFGVGDAWLRNGVKWNSASCQRSYGWQDCVPSPPDKQHGGLAGLVAADVFTIYSPIECDWANMASEGSLDDAVRQLDTAHAAYVISRALWFGEGLPAVSTDSTGDFGPVTVDPTLRSAAVDLSLETGAQPIEEAVAVLIAAWQECTGGNGGGVLHAPAVVVPYLFGGGTGGGKFVERQGDKLVIASLGLSVSPGPGYPDGSSPQGPSGNGPAIGGGNYQGNANNEVWLYITGPVEYAKTDPQLIQSHGMSGATYEGGASIGADPASYARMNRYEAIAESIACVRFDPCCTLAQLAQNPVGPMS